MNLDFETEQIFFGPLTKEQDPYNKHKTRNSYNTRNEEYNCMGYALDTYTWLCPYDRELIVNHIEELCYDYEMNFNIVANILLEEYTNWILEHFDNVKPCKEPKYSKLKNNEYIIAMRVYVDEDFGEEYYEDDDNYCEFYPDYDHHFLKYENGKWSDKPGSLEIRETPKDPWHNDSCDFYYNSNTQFFVVTRI